MSRSARKHSKPIGRQRLPSVSGGQTPTGNVEATAIPDELVSERRGRPIRVALVADDGVTAATALGGLPILPSRVVIIWRVGETEAQRGVEAGGYDCVAYSNAPGGRNARNKRTKTHSQIEPLART